MNRKGREEMTNIDFENLPVYADGGFGKGRVTVRHSNRDNWRLNMSATFGVEQLDALKKAVAILEKEKLEQIAIAAVETEASLGQLLDRKA